MSRDGKGGIAGKGFSSAGGGGAAGRPSFALDAAFLAGGFLAE